MAELVQDVAQKFQQQAERGSIRLETRFLGNLPFVTADIGMIERVLQNLLENALKFTPRSGLVVVDVAREDDSLRVRVTDTGCGIPAGEISNVFERFYRSSRNHATTDGAGLGLAIVKRIVELHRGNISVESGESSGSSFAFTLPLHRKP